MIFKYWWNIFRCQIKGHPLGNHVIILTKVTVMSSPKLTGVIKEIKCRRCNVTLGRRLYDR